MDYVTATVLVPTHEHGPLLHFSVRSALQQTVEDLEVFIVCDGATDDTLEAAEGLAVSDDRVRVFVNEKGPGTARSTGTPPCRKPPAPSSATSPTTIFGFPTTWQ